MPNPKLFAAALALMTTQAQLIPQFIPNTAHPILTGTAFGLPYTNATYDFIIIGGGLAGSVVASRLTQHSPNTTVAVIEPGSFYELTNGNDSQIPFFSEKWVGAGEDDWHPLIDWGLFTEPQVNGKRIHYAQGKCLGGSSGRNQMLYHRPTKGAYQMWADKVGDESYTWEEMLPYLKRSMRFDGNAKHRDANTTFHDTSAFEEGGGPLSVSYQGFVWPISEYARGAFGGIGQKEIPGFASGELDGWGWWQSTVDPEFGLRSSAQRTFLAEAIGRPNLKVYLNSQASNVLFDEEKVAKGVNVTLGGQKHFTLTARKEVILAAGAWHSPQVLMLSGVGPKETLEKYGIDVLADRQGVGQNMWDSHNVGGIVWEVSVPGMESWMEEGRMENATKQLLETGGGPLSNFGNDVVSFDLFPRGNLSASSQQFYNNTFPADWPLVENSLSSSRGNLVSGGSDDGKYYSSVGNLLVAPASRGNVTIRSNSILDRPVINPNWLLEKEDQELAIAAWRRSRETWKGIPEGIRLGKEVYPGENVTTDEQLLEHIMDSITPIHHSSASCAMGRVDDEQAVVDNKGLVIGVNNLRIVDSSSFPFTPPGHTQGVAYAHAEKMSDEILIAHGLL